MDLKAIIANLVKALEEWKRTGDVSYLNDAKQYAKDCCRWLGRGTPVPKLDANELASLLKFLTSSLNEGASHD